ncbi:DNA topoisomerase I [Candidatus Methanocrinis natronophilus]|uniref:DNA topoisomerase 1 n=1 Tax=Candidatus Methanocrinis natronophilus TaxID=3033396 RepID=A0ABT5X841_9EURY|nr:DNA topoisomerase I [Candidatus Methanocrinis natronophilus]MDF0590870.1 DNA topoisomerase I [Candidatus Methanocrinis natronophilus]
MHLIIAEKHNVAKRIAQILAGTKPKVKRVHGIETFHFDDKVVMGLSGHIVGVDYPPGYNNWQKVDYRDLIHAEVVTKPTQAKMVSTLNDLGREADRITIATDYDREGELIGVEALRIAEEANPRIKADRVRFSAITKGEILDAFKSPGEVDYALASSGEARQVVDLIWGAALTRFISITAGRLGKGFLSVGRVQSPTLALIVDREKEIQAFKPQPYWEISAELEKELTVKHEKGRIWDGDLARSIFEGLGEEATVLSIKEKTRTDRPPAPFDTTAFISAASGIGFSASNAMRIAEWLYTSGFISYPRTENTVYPATIDLRALVAALKKGPFREDAEQVLKGPMVPTRGKRISTDHPPIYPTAPATKKDMKPDQWKIYELVVRRFLATLSEPSRWITMNVKLDIHGEPFKALGARQIEAGWRGCYPYSKAAEEILPPLTEGEKLQVLGKDLAEKETQPPSRYGQGRLVKLMDELGLGTKSTRHEIISKLYARAYVQGNPMKPTNTAYAVIEALERHSPTITKPEMTRTLEEGMTKIAERKIREGEVVDESRSMLDAVFDDLLRHQEEIETTLREGLRTDKIVGNCPDCKNELIIRRGRRGSRFIGCAGYPNCTHTLPLPKFGMIVVTDKVCTDHGMYHIRIINKGKRPWDLGCPKCNFDQWQAKKAEEAREKAQVDALADIPGIGPKTLEKLAAAGVKTALDLAAAQADDLAEKTGLKINKISSWQLAARTKADKAQSP